jgi:hypothetical protein
MDGGRTRHTIGNQPKNDLCHGRSRHTAMHTPGIHDPILAAYNRRMATNPIYRHLIEFTLD